MFSHQSYQFIKHVKVSNNHVIIPKAFEFSTLVQRSIFFVCIESIADVNPCRSAWL